ncbi:MAG: copper resistance protein CopC, partial [Chloroflexota bacterium]|nr:copper resistance protein CopC [Chloroflexota bacterium]
TLPLAVASLMLLVAPALPGATGSRVLAHAQLVASSPGAGSSIEAPPDELRLIFSEPLEDQVTSLDIADETGTLLLDRAGSVDPADRFALVVEGSELVDLPDGAYTVTWRTLSAADGHTAEGTFSFAIGTNTAVPATSTTAGMTHNEASPLDVIGRWLTYLGLLLALGVAIAHRVVIGRRPMPHALVRMLGIGLLISGMATLLVVVANAMEAGGDVIAYLTGSRTGILQVARGLVALAAGAILLAFPAWWARLVAGGAGLVGIAMLVAAGHAAALPGPVPVLAGGVHVAAAGVWIGGLAVLLLTLSRPAVLFGAEHRPPPMRMLVPRFSALALVSIGLIGLTGVYSAWSQTGVLVDPGTEYGQRLIMKSVVAAAAIGLGGLNYLDGGRMRRMLAGVRNRLTVETGLAAVVLLLTASLATTPPVEEVPGVAITPVPDAFGATTPGMTLTLSPGRPGVNRVAVTTTDAMAMITGGLELGLDRLDAGTTTRVPLTLAQPSSGHGGHDPNAEPRGSDSPVDWIADAVVLPAGSSWDASVLVVAVGGNELARQRFSFALSDDGVADGAIRSLADPVTGVAGLLLIGGAIGLGLSLGGGRLPRCDPQASRTALRIGGLAAVILGAAIGLDRLLTLV